MRTMIQAIDGRAQVLANCRVLYGPLVEVVTLAVDTYGATHQAVAIKVDPRSDSWEKLLHGESKSSTTDAINALLKVSEGELSNRIAAGGAILPFRGNQIQRERLHCSAAETHFLSDVRNDASVEEDMAFEMVPAPLEDCPVEYITGAKCYPNEPAEPSPTTESYPEERCKPDLAAERYLDMPAEPEPEPETEPVAEYYPMERPKPDLATECDLDKPADLESAEEHYKGKFVEPEPEPMKEDVGAPTVNSTYETTQSLPSKNKKAPKKQKKIKKSRSTSDYTAEAQPLEPVESLPLFTSTENPDIEAVEKHIVEVSEETPTTSFDLTEGQDHLPIRKGHTVVLRIMYTDSESSFAIQKMVDLATNTKTAILEAVNSCVEERVDIDHAKKIRKTEIKSGASKFGELDVSALDASRWPQYLDYFCQYTTFPELAINVMDIEKGLVGRQVDE